MDFLPEEMAFRCVPGISYSLRDAEKTFPCDGDRNVDLFEGRPESVTFVAGSVSGGIGSFILPIEPDVEPTVFTLR